MDEVYILIAGLVLVTAAALGLAIIAYYRAMRSEICRG